jgi:hypothetical protein
LERQLADLKEENASQVRVMSKLQEQLVAAGAGGAGPVTPESVAAAVFQLRGRTPEPPLRFAARPRSEIDAQLAASVRAGRTPDQLRDQLHALVTVGFVFDPEFETNPTFDMDEAIVGLRTSQESYYFDPATNTLAFPDNAPLANPDERLRFVEGVVRAMARTLPGAAAQAFATDPRNYDRSVAARSLSVGDAVQVKTRYALLDSPPGGAVPPASPESSQPFYGAPVMLREMEYFPYFMGEDLVQALHERGGWAAVDAAYARPPGSTAEVMHPELYLTNPPFAPEPVALDRSPVDGRAPLWDDTAGEAGVLLLLKMLTSPERSEAAAAGWKGDRWIAYPGGAYHWQTRWSSPGDATEFAAQVQEFLVRRYELSAGFEEAAGGGWTLETPGHSIRLRLPPGATSVAVTVAAEPAFADALEAKFGVAPGG